jgi:hypothetical protein
MWQRIQKTSFKSQTVENLKLFFQTWKKSIGKARTTFSFGFLGVLRPKRFVVFIVSQVTILFFSKILVLLVFFTHIVFRPHSTRVCYFFKFLVLFFFVRVSFIVVLVACTHLHLTAPHPPHPPTTPFPSFYSTNSHSFFFFLSTCLLMAKK